MASFRVWLLIAGACLFAFLVWLFFRWRFRKEQRTKLIEELKLERPDLELLEQREGLLRMRGGDGKEMLYRLDAFYAALEMTNRRPTTMRGVVRKFALAIAEGRREVTKLTIENDGKRILPRLVQRSFLENPARRSIPRKELEGTGLLVVYCLDNEQAVRFLKKEERRELDLNGGALHKLALANLGARGDMRAVAKAALESDAVNVVSFGDAFDATRVLLLPKVLQKGEALAAIVPDRDTLLLARAPKAGDWAKLVDLARSVPRNDGFPLLEVPLLVDAKGVRRYDAPPP